MADFADAYRASVTDPPPSIRRCWACEGPLETFGVSVHGRLRLRRHTRALFGPICLSCYLAPEPEPGAWFKRITAITPPKPCEHCGQTIVRENNGKFKVFTCSDICRIAKTRTPRRDIDGITCQQCGTQITGRANRKYCSAACRQRAHRAHREVIEADALAAERPHKFGAESPRS
jgi:endogenous inhibitor of DNA gyrase (YacG/DUF329 family)